MVDPKVVFVFWLHIDNDLNSGTLGFRGGPIMASADTFEIKVIGRGGHGAYPHETVDPVYVAAQVIIALQGVSGRMIDPIQPFVITIGSIHSGTKRSEEHTSELQSHLNLVCRLLLEKKKKRSNYKLQTHHTAL